MLNTIATYELNFASWWTTDEYATPVTGTMLIAEGCDEIEQWSPATDDVHDAEAAGATVTYGDAADWGGLCPNAVGTVITIDRTDGARTVMWLEPVEDDEDEFTVAHVLAVVTDFARNNGADPALLSVTFHNDGTASVTTGAVGLFTHTIYFDATTDLTAVDVAEAFIADFTSNTGSGRLILDRDIVWAVADERDGTIWVGDLTKTDPPNDDYTAGVEALNADGTPFTDLWGEADED